MKTILAAVFFLGFTIGVYATDRAVDEDNIREVILRSACSGNEPFFVEFESEPGKASEPSDAFLHRFAGGKIRIARFSDSKVLKDEGDSVVDIQTGEHGVRIYIGKIDWISDREVVVGVASYTANLGGGGARYVLRLVDGKWEISKRQQTFIS